MIVRNLLAELAERVDVRLLAWKGAPVPLFKPSHNDVREMLDGLTRHTKIEAHADGCTGFTHSHHEKTIVIDGKVAFVGGIDLTLDGGDPWDTPSHVARGGIGWHDAAVRIEGPAVADVAQHFRLRWHGATREAAPAPDRSGRSRRRRGADREDASGRHVPRACAGATTRSSSRTSERCARPSGSSTWRTSSCGRPRSCRCSPRSSENPPSDDFRVLVLLPARANDGADISRGQVAALIHAADETTRFLACTIYARSRNLRDPGVRPFEDRDRGRPLAHRRLGEPERTLAVQRHRDERRHPRPRACTGGTASPLVGAPRASARGGPGRPDRADRRALGAHLVGAARAPRGERGAHAPAREAAGGLAAGGDA